MTVGGMVPALTPARSDGSAAACTWEISASAVMPANMATAMPPSSARVVAAFLLLGFLNAGTPLLIASTPVSAVQPEEKARSSRKTSAKPVKSCAFLIRYAALTACR